ncbi:NAD(P)H-dependent flavin oxidoreductase [Bauldia sp.]|uniref:NAD(P)H-dependent flavin oxidoreductase n=1 Tax=Bauldia sp. TaxID=2575872 RepID=UPI003BAB6962
MWPDTRLLDLFGVDLPIIQAPMAGASGPEMAIAVSEAGGLGSLPGAMLTPDTLAVEMGIVRQRTDRPVNINFFCHRQPVEDPERWRRWEGTLKPYYDACGIEPRPPGPSRVPFDDAFCAEVEAHKPEVVSFHFGLPPEDLLRRVKATGARIISTATTVAEAKHLAERGCDVIIAQGLEAGGHRGSFLSADLAVQMGTLALVPQIVDAVPVPVIAAGGIADSRGVVACLALGASAVQIGTAYLRCPESIIHSIYRDHLAQGGDTVVTNVFTGRPARGFVNRLVREVGPWRTDMPDFPLPASALGPLKAKAEERGSNDFSSMWAGQAVGLCREVPAAQLTHALATEALQRIRGFAD